MDRFVARANIDHYLDLLSDGGCAREKRAMVTKLLVEQEDKLGHDLEQLEFAERRVADGRDRLNHLRSRLDLVPEQQRAEAEQLVANFEDIQNLLESFCRQMRDKVNTRR
jgi:hypothetical protein